MNTIRKIMSSLMLTCFLFAGCSESSAPSTDASADVVTDAPSATNTEANAIVIGTYIDPSTMAVGGTSSVSAQDRLFAGIRFPPTSGGTVIIAKVVDNAGAELVRKELTVADISQTSINFDMGSPADNKLQPGDYLVTISVPNQPTVSSPFTVR